MVIEAARLVPECDFLVTGDVAECPPAVRAAAPDNVNFVGFLDPVGYRGAVEEANMVLTLTTEPLSVMRAAYEAVYAERPVILSDWPINRELFADAVHVCHRPEDLAAGVREVCAGYDHALARTGRARDRQMTRWEAQRAAVLAAASD
jgi:hypothetical protein